MQAPGEPQDYVTQIPAIPGIDYFNSVRLKLNPGNGDIVNNRHDKELVRREEQHLVGLLENLSQDEKARLDENITLVSSMASMPNMYQQPDAPQNESFSVPRKIRLMSTYISRQLKENPQETVIQLDVPAYYLRLIIDYCQVFDYLKVKSTIKFPAENNILEQNVSFPEWNALHQIENDLEALQALFVYCKVLGIDALYELTACAIACIFKTRQLPTFSQQH